MKENGEKVIHIHNYYTKIGYISYKDCKLIYHSFDDEPAHVWNDGNKLWYKDGNWYRDNNLPAIIYSDGNYTFYKNNILYLIGIKNDILKENGIVDATWFYDYYYIILEQSQYNLAILKFL